MLDVPYIRQREQVLGVGGAEFLFLLGGELVRHVSGHAGNHHTGATGGDDLAKFLHHQGHTDQVYCQDGGRGRLRRRKPRGVRHLSDPSQARRGLGQPRNRSTRRDVDALPDDVVSIGLQLIDDGLQRLLVVVGEQQRLADALTTGDDPAHPADADDDDDLIGHSASPLRSKDIQ